MTRPDLLDHLGGQVRASESSSSCSFASRIAKLDRPLFPPFHKYSPIPFSGCQAITDRLAAQGRSDPVS